MLNVLVGLLCADSVNVEVLANRVCCTGIADGPFSVKQICLAERSCFSFIFRRDASLICFFQPNPFGLKYLGHLQHIDSC